MRVWHLEGWDENARSELGRPRRGSGDHTPRRTRGEWTLPGDVSVDRPMSRRAMLAALFAGGAALAGGGWFLKGLVDRAPAAREEGGTTTTVPGSELTGSQRRSVGPIHGDHEVARVVARRRQARPEAIP